MVFDRIPDTTTAAEAARARVWLTVAFVLTSLGGALLAVAASLGGAFR